MKHNKTHIALALIKKATNQPWEFSEDYNALVLHTPNGFYLLTTPDADVPEVQDMSSLVLGWYPNTEQIIDSVKNLETLTAWATGYSA